MSYYVPAILISFAGCSIALLAIEHAELALRRWERGQAERARAPEPPQAAV